MASFSPPTHVIHSPFISLKPKNPSFLLASQKASALTEVEPPAPEPGSREGSARTNVCVSAAVAEAAKEVSTFKDARWVEGTWDLKQFQKNGSTNWGAVIDAEARRRKWLEDNPESSSNDSPVVFDTSIIPWWAWIKLFHLPEAERLNGRAAMVGFLMAYVVDSLTGVGVVDQMNNFVCKTVMLIAVVGVLAIQKNEDVENVKKLLEETTFYDKQWQATWEVDEIINSPRKE